MGSTPIYGIPFSGTTDPPHGPNQQQALAEAVETQIARMDTQPTLAWFTSGGNYAKPTGLKFICVHVQAGGGGSAGAGTAVAASSSLGAPGGGGEYARAFIPASSLSALTAVTVGAGGVGAAAVGGSGGAGGTSSFGAFVTAIGGGGGSPLNNVTFGASNGGVSGSGGGGTAGSIFRIPGKRGDAARVMNGEPFPAAGGDAHLGFGAPIATAQSTTPGVAGLLYGGGASSSWVRGSAGVLGSAGGQGVVIVESYF